MTHQRRRRRPPDRDRGSITLFLAITGLGLLVLAGLIADGGAKLRATQRADAVAAEAARAAGQTINLPAAIADGTTTINPHAATAAARTHLAAAGMTGTVRVADGGRTLQVSVSDTAQPVFLGLIGVTSLEVTGHASVDLVHRVTGAGP